MQPRINYMNDLKDHAHNSLMLLGMGVVGFAIALWILILFIETCFAIHDKYQDYLNRQQEQIVYDYDNQTPPNIEYLVFNKFNNKGE